MRVSQVLFNQYISMSSSQEHRENDIEKDVLSLVMNPVQNPNTTPRTIENCSSAINEPRTSGGLISAM